MKFLTTSMVQDLAMEQLIQFEIALQLDRIATALESLAQNDTIHVESVRAEADECEPIRP